MNKQQIIAFAETNVTVLTRKELVNALVKKGMVRANAIALTNAVIANFVRS